jgi:hypothetical protein
MENYVTEGFLICLSKASKVSNMRKSFLVCSLNFNIKETRSRYEIQIF